MRPIAIATLCAGCAQLAGIKDTSKPAGEVTLQLQRVYVGATLATEPLVLATAPSVILSGSTVPALPTTPGTYTANATDPLGVFYTGTDLPMPVQHLLSLGATMSADETVFVHQNASAPDPAAAMTLNVTLPGSYETTQTLQVVAIGAWSAHTLSGMMELPGVGTTTLSASIAYSTFLPMTTQSPIVKIVKADQVVITRSTGQTLTGQLIVPPFDQTASDMITGTMAMVTPTAPFDATIDPTTISTRLGTVQPAGTSFSSLWRLDASPGYAVGQSGGIQLDGGSLAMTATSISSSYANPFAGLSWKPVLEYASYSSRTYMMGTMPVSLTSYLIEERDPAPGLMLDVPAALPQTATLGTTVLSTDGLMINIDATAPTPLTFTTESGTATLYGATVYELAPDMTGAIQRNRVLAMLALAPSFSIPAGVLQNGHTYEIDCATVSGGYTGAASGNLQTFAFPASFAIAATGVFTAAGG